MDAGELTMGRHVARPHQEEAIRAAVEGFSSASRGTVVMACGTGKTLVGQRVTEALISGVEDPRVLVTFPSIQLLDQTLRSWRRDALLPFDALAFCSDSTVGSDGLGTCCRDGSLATGVRAGSGVRWFLVSILHRWSGPVVLFIR